MSINQPEPAPVANNQIEVWPAILKRMANVRMFNSEDPETKMLLDAVMSDMQERDLMGRERYGVPLQPHNGRNSLVDGYQEALDLLAYLQQARMEHPEDAVLSHLWIDTLDIILRLKIRLMLLEYNVTSVTR